MDSELYLRVREKEGRLYSDEAVRRLPDIPRTHPLGAEWRARAESSARLTAYLARLPGPFSLLELGCGNGWLANLIAQLSNSRVIGMDVNCLELAQAARVFGSNRRLLFMLADILCAPFRAGSLDIVVVASAIQYFPDPAALVRRLLPLLSERGEIHILDSPLYASREVAGASARTRDYFAGLGFPEMAEHYHHHTLDALADFRFVRLYDPAWPMARLRRRLRFADSPFLWLRLRP